MKVYFLNGPPRSGKDTAGELMRGVLPLKFAAPLKAAAHGLVGRLTDEHRIYTAQPADFEATKDVVSNDFLGLSPRDWYIGVSERLIKPMLGDDFFGKLMARNIKQLSTIFSLDFAITDCGFESEIQPVVDEVGAKNCAIIQLYRKGCTFAGDSRGYVTMPEVRQVVIHNDGTLEDLRIALAKVQAWKT